MKRFNVYYFYFMYYPGYFFAGLPKCLVRAKAVRDYAIGMMM